MTNGVVPMVLPDPDKLWAAAIEHHLAGRVAEAEALYRRLLAGNPQNAKALHMLGMAEFQLEHPAEGLKLVESAIASDPNNSKYHGHRGLILASLGNLDAAIDAYRAAIAIAPNASDILNNLGAALSNRGDTTGAIDAYRHALRADPSQTKTANNLASLLTNSGRHGEAVAILRTAAREPVDGSAAEILATALNNLGAECERNGDAGRAIDLLRESLLLRPQFAAAWFNLGKSLVAQHRPDEAIAAYRSALACDPEMAEAYNNLGIAFNAAGQVHAAIEQYAKTLQRNPRQANVLNNLGNAFRSTGKLLEAESSYRKAIAIDPGTAAYWSNLGSVLDAQERSDEALTAFSQAVALRPDFSEAHNNIGNAKKNLGDIDGALAAYRHATEVQPDNQGAHSNRLYTMYFHPDYSADTIAAAHREWSAQHAARFAPRSGPVRPPHSRLRIGYVAPNFRDHCQSFFTVPLFSHHDRGQFEIYAYSDVAAPDAITARLRGWTDIWRNTVGMPDESLAERIRSDEIDILVDLSLHMSDNRLLTFARKPAPLQITWLGYPGTTGLETIDYRLTDPFLDPPAVQNAAYYSERSHRLPDTFWCYDPLTSHPAVNELPLLKNGFVTFGCLNNFCKVNLPTLDLWARVLNAVPRSKLLLLAPKPARQRILDALASRGVEAGQIEFAGRMNRTQYLASYHRIDIGLDTIPYNGHTTSLDAFWMGVPVITLVGDAPVGRAGWSQLSNLQLTELAGTSPNEFVGIATGVAEHAERSRDLRRSLRDRLAASPLMDGARFARNVETAYRAMWDEL